MSEEDFLAAVDHVEDDVLRLMFVCCHPVLRAEAQCTLTLKLVGGLTTREIARAYLTSETTVAQRVVRAKRTLSEAEAAMEEPSETPSVRGDLFEKLGRREEARAEFARAATMTQNERERRLLLDRARAPI